jgi:hypothetical protein
MRWMSLFVGLSGLAAVVAGCFHPAVITPEPMPAGDFSLGLGVSGTPASEPIVILPTGWLQARAGLGLGVDAGLRLSIPSGPYADIKWNFLKVDPWLATVDIGASYLKFKGSRDMQEHFTDDTMVYAFYPALLFGTSNLFGGARLTLARRYGYYTGPGKWDMSPSIVLGGSFGDQVRIMPGIDVVVPPAGFGVTLMVGVEAHTRSRAASSPDPGW